MERASFREFLNSVMESDGLPPYSGEQWDALCDDKPMTQELYNAILDLCCEHGNCEEYLEIRGKFPEFNEAHNKHFAEKYGYTPRGRFGDDLELDQFDFILEKYFEKKGIVINDGLFKVPGELCD